MAAGGDGEKVRLMSSEGEVFDVTMDVIKVSRTLSTMITDLGHRPDDVIPLPNVSTRILRKVLAWAEHYIKEQKNTPSLPNHPPQVPHPPSSPTTPPSNPTAPFQPRPHPYVPQRSSHGLHPPLGPTLTQWEKDFITKNKDDVYDLLLAANYLDIKGLLDILCRTVADMIKGKDPEDIRRAFHASIPSHLTTDTPPSSPQLAAHSHTPSPAPSASDSYREQSSSRGFKESTV